jgi:hypothetical protein
MARGKKYSKEEWEAALSLRKMGKRWPEISNILGRGENGRCAEIFKKYNNYEEYDAAVSKRIGKRKTEQLQFLPPKLPKAPKKIQVKGGGVDELTAYKLRMATNQAVAVRNFILELQDAGFKIKLG